MRRSRRPTVDAPGQDSFLDVVANLVGILLILITVIGVRARTASVEAAVERQAAPTLAIDAKTPRQAAEAVQADIHRIDAAIRALDTQANLKRLERDKLFAFVTAFEKKLTEEQEQLDSAGREAMARGRDLLAAQSELERLQQRRAVLAREASTTAVLPHVPTPLAKTVFGREEHFRLSNGYLARVPWEEMVERLKSEARQKVWKLREAPQITEVIGPVEGFHLKYTLKVVEERVETGAGPMMQKRIELDHFTLLPVSEPLGEPLAAALGPQSEFRRRALSLDPRTTTITVWVYPDDFAGFRQLKQELYQAGFLTAARPLPADHPIGGSPRGVRSTAQ